MTLTEILLDQANYVVNSGVAVDYDEEMGTVCIYEVDNDENCFYLQGNEGYDWVEKMKQVWEEAGNLSLQNAELAAAYPYLDCLFH